jgi:hypothetical protein
MFHSARGFPMKKIVHLFFFATAFFLVTCEDDEEKASDCQVIMMKVTQDNETDSVLVSYDSDDRVTEIDLGEGWSSVYTYGTSKVTEKSYINYLLSSTNVYTLNFDGYAMSSIHTHAGSDDPESSTTYDFDENGYLISEIEVDAQDADNRKETYYEYEGGNLIHKETDNLKTSYHSETEYEYYTDKLDKFTNHMTYLGKPNKNLVKKSTSTSDVITLISNYSYQLDKDGYVTNEIQTIGTVTLEMEYIYECD